MAGKRQFRRTTSMTGITVDLEEPAGQPLGFQISPITGDPVRMDSGAGGPRDHSLMAAMVSPRHNRRRNNNPTDNSNKCAETTAHFLRTCGLCQRRLAPGRDIYMYRGDTAFCSIECREQQMKHDEEKNKCLMVVAHNASSMTKEEYHHHNHNHANYSETSTTTSDASGNTQTFAAA